MSECLKIAIIVALQAEFDLVKNIFENYEEIFEKNISFIKGQIANNEVVLVRCGIGKVNAAVQLSELIGIFDPDYAINTGVAGGIDKGLSVGDVVVSTKCAYHDVWCGDGSWGQVQGLPLYFEGSKVMLQKLKALSTNNTHFGLICTGDQFITELTGLQTIKTNFPNSLAVDMESAAMAHVCYLRNVPFVSIRVISDTPEMSHDNTSQYFDFWKDAPKRTFELLKKLLD
ncbi:MAG: 5'-methylthioadenosine/adenosylhomocysteine nucleosidase [Prevotellaceae bacterium]|nr:5'-methylthioadenosine/adenosylhomocysteine nucleosidase [Prevotellaceae bacterium]